MFIEAGRGGLGVISSFQGGEKQLHWILVSQPRLNVSRPWSSVLVVTVVSFFILNIFISSFFFLI